MPNRSSSQYTERIQLSQHHEELASAEALSHYGWRCIGGSTYRLFDRCGFVETMALKHVDIVKLETRQASFDGIKYVLAGKAILINIAVIIWIHS